MNHIISVFCLYHRLILSYTPAILFMIHLILFISSCTLNENTSDVEYGTNQSLSLVDDFSIHANSSADETNRHDIFLDEMRNSESIDMLLDLDPIPLAGGATTHNSRGVGSFVQAASNLSLRRRGRFEAGLQFFQLTWEPTPNRSEIDGLGPTYNARSCIGCHQHNGRGKGPFEYESNILVRLGNENGVSDSKYGSQLQTNAIPGVRVEGRMIAMMDSTVYHSSDTTLISINYNIDALAFGPLDPTINLSARITPQLVGMGLIDAITEQDLLALEDVNDVDGDGISGRIARTEEGEILRFGWKATQHSVLTQCAAAFFNDMGITSLFHPTENCPPIQEGCHNAPSSPLDIDEIRLEATATYVSLLGVPAHRHTSKVEYHKGLDLFVNIGCATCHHPRFITGISKETELSFQEIWPYSDFLLHDMGEGLNDGVAEGDALASEWRTPPLWGLGLVPEVNGSLFLLHDGRARSIKEAILWHGGEAYQSTVAFELLDEEQKELLIRFVQAP